LRRESTAWRISLPAILTGAAVSPATRELNSDHRSPKRPLDCVRHESDRPHVARQPAAHQPKRNSTMSKKATRLHRTTYETAGAMIRAGLWTIEYAAFHFSTVTASLHA
jgi:hypothetical protein